MTDNIANRCKDERFLRTSYVISALIPRSPTEPLAPTPVVRRAAPSPECAHAGTIAPHRNVVGKTGDGLVKTGTQANVRESPLRVPHSFFA